jgi:hypothetical protein
MDRVRNGARRAQDKAADLRLMLAAFETGLAVGAAYGFTVIIATAVGIALALWLGRH